MKAPDTGNRAPRATCTRRRRRTAATSRGTARSRATAPMPIISARGSRPASQSTIAHALAVGADQVAAPDLAVGAHFDRPVALALLVHGLIEPNEILDAGAGLAHVFRPGIDVGEHPHLGHRATQRHAALIGVVASETGRRKRQQATD